MGVSDELECFNSYKPTSSSLRWDTSSTTTHMIFTVFLASAILAVLGFAFCGPLRGKNGPRPDGVAFIVAVLLPLIVGWWFAQYGSLGGADVQSPDALTKASMIPPELSAGWTFALLTLGVYVLSALRGVGRFPGVDCRCNRGRRGFPGHPIFARWFADRVKNLNEQRRARS